MTDVAFFSLIANQFSLSPSSKTTFGQLSLSATVGTVELVDVRAETLSVISVAGDLTLLDVRVQNRLEVRIATGLVKADPSTRSALTLGRDSSSDIALG